MGSARARQPETRPLVARMSSPRAGLPEICVHERLVDVKRSVKQPINQKLIVITITRCKITEGPQFRHQSHKPKNKGDRTGHLSPFFPFLGLKKACCEA